MPGVVPERARFYEHVPGRCAQATASQPLHRTRLAMWSLANKACTLHGQTRRSDFCARHDAHACEALPAARLRHAPIDGWHQPCKRATSFCSQQGDGDVSTCAHGSTPAFSVTSKPPGRLAVFVSGGGSNMKAIHKAILESRMNATISVVVSDVPSCGGVAYAQEHGIPTLTYPIPKKGGFPGLTVPELVEALNGSHKADYVILAGYLKLIPSALVHAFPKAMLNIHPGLLPAFGGKGMYGHYVHEAVVASGARFSGPTVHFVDEEFDTGPILAQRAVPVCPTDTPAQVAAKVLKEEHQVYPQAVSALVDGRITWREDGVPIMWEAH